MPNLVTDKELLAICNLSNLKMEFADVAKTRDQQTNEILSNHTIYSLIEKELKGIKNREEWNKNWEKNNSNLKNNSTGSTYSDISDYLLEEKKRRQDFSNESSEKKAELGSFYFTLKNEEVVYSYENKITLQKKAPIIMEYYDRLQYGNEEGKFLDEWEIIYGGDFYEMKIDYAILLENELYKVNKNNPTIRYYKDKKEYKKNREIPFREEIIKDKKKKENYVETFNFAFDLITTILPEKQFLTYIKNKFSSDAIIDILKLSKTDFIHKEIEKTGKLFEDIVENIPNSVQAKTVYENIEVTNFFEEIYNNLLKKTDKNLLELKYNIKFDLENIRVTIVKKKNSNDFIVAFNSSGDNKIIDDLKKGRLNFDLLIFNTLIESEIRKKVSKNFKTNVYFTGYGNGAILATASFLVLNSSFGIFQNQENINDKLEYYNKSFIGEEYVNFTELINFNLYDIEKISPGSFKYSVNLEEDFKNFFNSIWSNGVSTGNIALIANILLNKSVFEGLLGVFSISGIGKVVYLTLFFIHIGYATFNRKRLKTIEENFISNDIIKKDKNQYFEINEKTFDYTLAKNLNLNFISNKEKYFIKIRENKYNYISNVNDVQRAISIIEELAEIIYIKNKEKLINLKEVNIFGKKMFLPIDIAIEIIKSNKLEYFLNGNIITVNGNLICVLNTEGRFKAVIQKNIITKVKEYTQFYLTPANFEEITTINFLYYTFEAQKKYNKKLGIIKNSEFIYFDDCSSKKDKKIFYDLEQQFYQEKQIKLKNENTTKTLKVDKLEENYLQSKDIVPYSTQQLSKIKGLSNNNIYNIGLPYSEFIYFPFLDESGKITDKIRKDYIGTVLRSLYREEIKYDTFEVNEDAEYEGYFLNGEVKEKNSKLNNYFIQFLKIEGKKICYPEHYNSMMELLKENPSLIEEYYNIEITNENAKETNIKLGILEKNKYAMNKIGFIYNQDKLYGRAVDLVYYFNEETLLEDISTFGVCQNATLECTCGSKPGNLKVISQNNEYSDDFLDATEEDKTTTGFGKCSITDSKCSPSLIKWIGVSKGGEINGKKELISTSTINCKTGGLVSIKEPNCKLRKN